MGAIDGVLAADKARTDVQIQTAVAAKIMKSQGASWISGPRVVWGGTDPGAAFFVAFTEKTLRFVRRCGIKGVEGSPGDPLDSRRRML